MTNAFYTNYTDLKFIDKLKCCSSVRLTAD